VKAHLKEKDVVEGVISAQDYFGNDKADGHAKEAARLGQVSPASERKVAECDKLASAVQKRMISINQECFKLGKRKLTRVQKPRARVAKMARLQKLRMLGHEMVGCVDKYKCQICCRAASKTGQMSLKKLIDKGVCPGPPQRRPEATHVQVGSTTMSIHPSHCLDFKRGLYFCWSCGKSGSERIRGLAKVCKPLTTVSCKTGKGRELWRLRQGLPPKGDKWPDEKETIDAEKMEGQKKAKPACSVRTSTATTAKNNPIADSTSTAVGSEAARTRGPERRKPARRKKAGFLG